LGGADPLGDRDRERGDTVAKTARATRLQDLAHRGDADGVNTPYVIRRFDPVDWPLIRQTRLDMLTVDPRAFDAGVTEAAATDATAWMRWATGDIDTPRASWGVFDGEVCVGMIAAHRELDDCHVGALWIRPEDRGAGMAHRLLDAAEAWGRDVGCSRITLGVADWNTLQDVYGRRHYTRTGRFTRTRWGHNEIEMAKPVGT
jgi:GNAT superfamily N-acetyltransferase